MRRPRPIYFVGRALGNLRGAPLPAAVTAAAIAVAVFLFAALWMSAANARDALAGSAGDADHLSIFVARGTSPDAVGELEKAVSADVAVASVRVVTPDEGLAELRQTLGDRAGALDGVEAAATLPAVLLVRLGEEGLSEHGAAGATARLRRLAHVESIESATEWLQRYRRLELLGRWVVIGWGSILALGALLVVGNAARLAALLRREEIEVLRLVGASDAFVLAPFVIEGAIIGTLGALAGLGAATALHMAVVHGLDGATLLAPFLVEIRFLDPVTIACLAAAGPVVGAFGAYGAARRYLSAVPL